MKLSYLSPCIWNFFHVSSSPGAASCGSGIRLQGFWTAWNICIWSPSKWKTVSGGKSEKPLDFRGHMCLQKAVYTRVPTVPSSQLSKWLLLGVGAGFQLFHQLIRAVLKRVVQLQEKLLLRGGESHRFEATWKG